MGEDVAEALSEIEATRARLEHDIDELFGRLPEPAALAHQARTYGAVAVGTAAVVGAVAVRQKRTSERNARRAEARINAEELARAFSPHPPREDDGEGRSKAGLLALLVAVAALALTLANRASSPD